MGSSKSRPRKKGNHSHLAKVGTPENQEWEHSVRQGYLGGSWAWIVGIVFMIAIVAFVIILTTLD
jgi:hypothetical protein